MWSIIVLCQGCGQYEGPNIWDAPTIRTRIRQTAPPRGSGRMHTSRSDDPLTLAAFANSSRPGNRPLLWHNPSNLTGSRKAKLGMIQLGYFVEPTTWHPSDWTTICNWVYVTAHVNKWENLSPKTSCILWMSISPRAQRNSSLPSVQRHVSCLSTGEPIISSCVGWWSPQPLQNPQLLQKRHIYAPILLCLDVCHANMHH